MYEILLLSVGFLSGFMACCAIGFYIGHRKQKKKPKYLIYPAGAISKLPQSETKWMN